MSKATLPTIGILGVGKIGLSVARRLLAAGYPVVGMAREPLDEFVSLGGQVAETGKAIGEAADIIIEVLGSEAAFEALVFGEDGLTKASNPNPKYLLALSSHHLEFKQAQQERLLSHKIHLLDATVSGSPIRVDTGKSIIFVGGEKSTVEKLRPVLDVVSPLWRHVGDFGAATKLKFVNNTLSFIHGLAAAEALALATRMGLDPEYVVECLEHGTGGSAAFSFRGPNMARRQYPVTGDLRGALLVIESILEMAREVDAEMPLMSSAVGYYQRAVHEEGLGAEDVAQLYELLIAKRNGIVQTNHMQEGAKVVN